LERPLPLAEGRLNELRPRTLPLCSEALRIWIGFHDHVEQQLGSGGELEPVRGFANKLPEHAARISAALTLAEDIHAGEVSRAKMEAGIAVAQHYAAEALRLFGASRISGEMYEAQQLLTWLLTRWPEAQVSLPDIYRRGPNSIREAKRARGAVAISMDHGWLVTAPPGDVAGTFRREVWRIVSE
jgi:hypothetical protein